MPDIPEDLPLIFFAWAQDDTLVGLSVVRFYDALKAAGYKPEVHIFSSGGHGFGMLKRAKAVITGSRYFITGLRQRDLSSI
jgi:acetyl esterase/lipase